MIVVEMRGERAPTEEWVEEGGRTPVSTTRGLGSDTGAAQCKPCTECEQLSQRPSVFVKPKRTTYLNVLPRCYWMLHCVCLLYLERPGGEEHILTTRLL